MTPIARTASTALVLALAACGAAQVKEVPTVGVASRQDAARLAIATGEKLRGLPADGRLTATAGGDGGVLDATLTYACASSGTVTIVVSASHSASGVTSVTEDVTAASCARQGKYELDGHVTFASTLDLSQLASGKTSGSVAIDGAMAAVLYGADGGVDQSATVSYQHLSWELSAQVTVTPSGGCFSATATSSGTMTIGGVVYTPTGGDLAGAWGSFQPGSPGACP